MAFRICFLLLIPFALFANAGYEEPWGKDAALIPKKRGKIALIPPPREGIGSKIAESIILFHQNILSPIDGPRSHFRPTSSRYMLHAIRRYGFLKGYIKGCDRLMRENKDPWIYRTVVIDKQKFKWDPTF